MCKGKYSEEQVQAFKKQLKGMFCAGELETNDVNVLNSEGKPVTLKVPNYSPQELKCDGRGTVFRVVRSALLIQECVV